MVGDGLVRVAVIRLLMAALLVEGITPLMPFVAAEYALSPSQALLLLGCFQLATVLLQVLASAGTRHIGRWHAATWATVLLGTAAVLASCSTGLMPLLLLLMTLYAVNGIGADVLRAALRGELAAPACAQVLALAARAAEWMQLVLPLGVTSLVVLAGWRGALAALAVPVCLVGLWMALGGRRARPAPSTPAAPAPVWRGLLSCSRFYLPALLAAAYQFCCMPLLFGLPFLLSTRGGLSPLMMGVCLAMIHALCLAAQALGGWMLMRKSTLDSMRVGLLLMSVALLAMLAAHWGGEILVQGACVVVVMAGSFIMLPCLVQAMRVPMASRADAAQLFTLLQLLAGALGLLLTGCGALGFVPGLTTVSAISLALMMWLQPRVSWAPAWR